MTNLAFGPRLLAIPGPTAVPETVLQAAHRQSIDIYGGELVTVTEAILADLKAVFRAPSGRPYLYVANGHGGWEAAAANLFSQGDAVLALESGRFAVGWAEMAAAMGVETEILPGKRRGAVDPEALERRLRDDKGGRIKAVLAVHIDTSTGVVNDVPAMRAALDAAGHEALLLVDGVASIGCVPFEMEAWGVDLALTASQKGLMSPPGLAPMVAGPRAWAARERAGLRTRYWDWEFREGPEHYQKYCGTPPEHLLFAQRRALELLLREEGLEAAWARHAALAGAVRAAVEAWGAQGAVELNILEPSERCDTVTAIRTAAGYDAAALRAMVDQSLGVTLGAPIGAAGPGGAFRIAHMGHASAGSVMGALGATEAGMRALGWPIGEGALSAAAARLAEAARS